MRSRAADHWRRIVIGGNGRGRDLSRAHTPPAMQPRANVQLPITARMTRNSVGVITWCIELEPGNDHSAVKLDKLAVVGDVFADFIGGLLIIAIGSV